MSIYAGHSVQDHEQFLAEDLLPSIVGYAGRAETPAEVVVMAAFLSLATILQARGLSRETLMKAIDAAQLHHHDAPAGVH